MFVRTIIAALLMTPAALAQGLETHFQMPNETTSSLSALKARQTVQVSDLNILGFAKAQPRPVQIEKTTVVETQRAPERKSRSRKRGGY